MGDADYGTDGLWDVSVASPHTLLLLLLQQKAGKYKPRCDQLGSLDTAHCANSGNEMLA